ncbi:MAG: lysylphosphatidylglycerol synthase transmembrane domain-containing protein [Candidatus Omnitrophota bacterium]
MKKGAFLRVFISLLFIGILIFSFRGEMGEILRILKGIQPFLFFVSLFLQLVGVWMMSIRLKIMFHAQKMDLSLKEVVELNFLGIFFNNFLPTAAGGDISKAFFAFQKTKKKLESFACVLGDRFIGLFTLLALAFFGMFVLWSELDFSTKLSVGILFGIGSFFLSFMFSHRVARAVKFLFVPLEKMGLDRRVDQAYRFLHELSQNKMALGKALGISVVSHILFVASAFFLIRSLAASESFIRLFVVLPLVVALSMLPSLNGLGIREGAFIFYLGKTVGKGNAFALSILWLALMGIQSLIGGILYFFYEFRRIPITTVKEMAEVAEEIREGKAQ